MTSQATEPRQTAGRCHKCNVRWVWDGQVPRLRDASCPRCSGSLKATTHLFAKGESIIMPRHEMMLPQSAATAEAIRAKTYRKAPVVLNRRTLPRGVVPVGAVYVGRPTKWGNPFSITDPLIPPGYTREQKHRAVVDEYRKWIQTQPELLAALDELVGKDLTCWCAPLPCHADVLLELCAHLDGEA